MAAVKDDEFHNPYGDGNLPDPNDFMLNGDNLFYILRRMSNERTNNERNNTKG